MGFCLPCRTRLTEAEEQAARRKPGRKPSSDTEAQREREAELSRARSRKAYQKVKASRTPGRPGRPPLSETMTPEQIDAHRKNLRQVAGRRRLLRSRSRCIGQEREAGGPSKAARQLDGSGEAS